MSAEFLQIVSQFGAAGLIGLLWIAERRHASGRERHLTEAHRKLMNQEQSLEVLVNVVRDNTRAIASLEQTQRHLADLLPRSSRQRG